MGDRTEARRVHREDLHPCRKYEGRVTHNCLRMGEGHMAKHSVRNGGAILQKSAGSRTQWMELKTICYGKDGEIARVDDNDEARC